MSVTEVISCSNAHVIASNFLPAAVDVISFVSLFMQMSQIFSYPSQRRPPDQGGLRHSTPQKFLFNLTIHIYTEQYWMKMLHVFVFTLEVTMFVLQIN